jgi:hypothetical protein
MVTHLLIAPYFSSLKVIVLICQGQKNFLMQMIYYPVFSEDAAYPPYLMRPFCGKDLKSGEEIVSYRFSKVGRVVELSFVSLGSKWITLFVSWWNENWQGKEK